MGRTRPRNRARSVSVLPSCLRTFLVRVRDLRSRSAPNRPDQWLPVLLGLANGTKVDDGFDTEVTNWSTSTALDERARLAAEYAERFTLDHHGLDDEFWSRMSSKFSQAEIAELTMSIGSWIAFGRLNRVFGLDTMCTLG